MKKNSELTWQEKVAKRDDLLKKCDEHYKAVGDNEPTTDQRKEVSDWNREIEELEAGIDESRDYHELKSRLQGAYSQRQVELAGGAMEHPTANPQLGGRQRKTLGSLFTESKEIRDWLKDIAGGKDEIPDSAQIGLSPSINYSRKELIVVGDTSGALNSQVSAGALTQPDYQPLVKLPFAPLVLRDIISVGTTQSPIITYPREVSRTIAAKVVKEATATGGTSGQKPESSLKLEKVVAPVKTIAHWIPATKQSLSDAGQLRLLIDSFLMNGLEQVLEDELLNGDGTDDHLLGLENTPGVAFQEFTTDVLVTTRKARTKCEVDGLANPTAYLMNPRDWENIELLKDLQGRYYYGGPSILGNPRLWGLPVVISFKQRQGTCYCADFKTVALWDREQGNVRVAEQHSDFFTRNMVVILAEERLANGVFRPAAVVKTDIFNGPNS
jgi:HK97 family phage major capsid protein